MVSEENFERKEEERDNISLSGITFWAGSNKILVIAVIFALLCCAYTIYTASNYQQACNDHWMEQLERIGCLDKPLVQSPVLFNITKEEKQK